MATLPLPYQNRIKFPIAATFKLDVERLQYGGGYAQRVAKGGYNTETSEYQITWVGLTLAEMQDVLSKIRVQQGVSAFTWTPPHLTVSRKWTISEYKYQQIAAGRYEVEAKLTLEYDP